MVNLLDFESFVDVFVEKRLDVFEDDDIFDTFDDDFDKNDEVTDNDGEGNSDDDNGDIDVNDED